MAAASAAAASADASESSSSTTTQMTTIELVDYDGNPIPNQRYVLTVGGVQRGGLLDKDGKVELVLDDSATIDFPGLADIASA